MQSAINKNNRALAVGFILVLAVTMISIFKNSANKENISPEEKKENPSSNQQADNLRKISSKDLFSKIENGSKINIVDIRNPESFTREHILDSKNIPFGGETSDFSALDAKKAYIFVDENALEAMILVKNLFSSNESMEVFYLEGGFSNWKSQFYPVISEGDPFSFTDQAKVKYIKCDNLKKLIETEDNIYILDVRKNNAYNEGHLKNAVNIYLGDLEERRKEIPKGKKIILYDNDGLWAFKGAVRLFDMGITNVEALSEGLDVWKQKGFEIIK